MRIALVATYPNPIALGLRYISAYLRARGQQVAMFFMRSKRDTAEADFPPTLLSEFAERLSAFDLIGMSLMTNTFHRACVLTEAVRKAGCKSLIPAWQWRNPFRSLTLSASVKASR